MANYSHLLGIMTLFHDSSVSHVEPIFICNKRLESGSISHRYWHEQNFTASIISSGVKLSCFIGTDDSKMFAVNIKRTFDAVSPVIDVVLT